MQLAGTPSLPLTRAEVAISSWCVRVHTLEGAKRAAGWRRHCGFKSLCTLTERAWGQLSDAAPVSLDLTQPLTTVCTWKRKWKEYGSAAPSSLALVTSQIKAEAAITLRRNPTPLELLLQNLGPHGDIHTEHRRSTGLHPALAATSLTPVLPPTVTVATSMSWGKILLVPALAPALSPKPYMQTV